MSIIVLQTFTAAPGRYADMAAKLAELLIATKARQGAEFIHAAGDSATGVVTIYEQWDNAENLKAYTDWRMTDPSIGALMALIGGPPKIEQLTKVF